MFGHANQGAADARAVEASTTQEQLYDSSSKGMYKTLMKQKWDEQSGQLKSMPGNTNYGYDTEKYANGTFENWWKSKVWKDAFNAWDTEGHR
jgi:hypothetical protein